MPVPTLCSAWFNMLGLAALSLAGGCIPEFADVATPDCPAAACAPAPDGYLYATGHTPSFTYLLSGFLVDGDSGALTPLPGYPVTLEVTNGGSPFDPVLDSTGTRFVISEIGGDVLHSYVGGNGQPFVHAESKSITTGGLKRPVIAPGTDRVYLPAGNSIRGYEWDAGGSLVNIPGSPFSLTSPESFVIEPGGTFGFYRFNATVRAVSIDGIGALGDLGVLATAGAAVADIAVDPQGAFLAVLLFSGTVELYQIAPSPLGLTLVDSDTPAECLGATGIVAEPGGRFFYATCGTQHAFGLGYRLDRATPGLEPVPASPVPGQVPLLDGRWPVTFGGGKYIYNPTSGASTLQALRIDDATGLLTPLPGSPFSPGTGIQLLGGLAIH